MLQLGFFEDVIPEVDRAGGAQLSVAEGSLADLAGNVLGRGQLLGFAAEQVANRE
jgi:hypothetical protein